MLNIFPSILYLGILAPFLLRILVGAIFLEFGYSKLTTNKTEKIKLFETIGLRPGKFFIWIVSLLEILIGSTLIFGFWTQLSALIGSIIMLSAIYLKKQIPESMAGSKMYYLVILVILISLIFSGAGAFAFDLGL